ncbi:MAG: BA14K family protein, partial [Hyphomicrobiales bacterium]
MNRFVLPSVTAGVFGAAMMLSGTAPVSATTLPSAALAAPGETAGMVEQVQHRGERRARRGDRVRRYDRRRHGPRYSHRRSGFPHFHGGYYYSSPWWTGPSIGFGVTVPSITLGLGGGYDGHSAHVQWCLNRYRTYDPATDTY